VGRRYQRLESARRDRVGRRIRRPWCATGYGRSFDLGVFGSIFGHVVTQNLPVLANQSLSAPTTVTSAFTLATGPAANVFPTVPSDGLLAAPAFNVSPKARPNTLRLPTLDAWNLSVQRAITPTLSVTPRLRGQ
jgi:hypothetical protein